MRPIVTTPREGYRIEKIQFLSEPGIYIPAWVYVPDNKTGVLPTILYVSDEGMEADGMEFEGNESMDEAGSGLTHGVLDTTGSRGKSGCRGGRPWNRRNPAASSRLSPIHAMNFGSFSTWKLPWRTWRGLWTSPCWGCGCRTLCEASIMSPAAIMPTRQNLHVIGKGMGGLWCLYAAALDPRIRCLISVQSLLSYRSLTQVDRYLYGADVFVPDVLLHFDLPQVAAAIAGRPLTLIQPKDAMKNTVGATRRKKLTTGHGPPMKLQEQESFSESKVRAKTSIPPSIISA